MKPNGEVRELFTRFGFASLLRRLDGVGAKNQESRSKKQDLDKEFPLIGRRGETVYVCDDTFLADPPRAAIARRGDWYAYDAKSAIKLLRNAGIAIKGITFDVLLAAYVAGQFARDFSYRAIAAREIGDAHASPDRLFDVAGALEQKLSAGRLRAIFEDIEMPLIPILADMEERGIMIDRQFLKALARSVDARIDGLTEAIYKSAGEKFNIASPKQLSQILFEKLGLATRGLRKTAKGGVISTRESELEKLRAVHPIVDEILSYRELAKLKSTYIDVLPRLTDKKTGRVHTTFNQAVTSTGRLSSNNPNLQNIPILSETGRELRKAFIASPGFTLVCFDYSQIELRVAAHMADDKKMIAAFRQGLDIHRMTAAEIYNVALEDVTPELRRAAKTLNFGVLYGMGASALAENAGMSRDEAGRFIEEYFHDFSGIREYIEKTKQLAREQGFVESLFGRRRYIPEINSPNFRIRAEAERMAVNMPIQATATGDIIKMAMIAGAAWIKKEKLEDDVRLLLQVHDELVFEMREQVVGTVAPKIKKIMEDVAHLSVPIIVDMKAGPNWGEQKSL